jgi:hypothetical protein
MMVGSGNRRYLDLPSGRRVHFLALCAATKCTTHLGNMHGTVDLALVQG